MNDHNKEESIIDIIDGSNTTLKPILFTTYDKHEKFIINITYEDGSIKTVELVENDKNRPYTFTIKKEGMLITKTGVPRIREIKEMSNFCDFVNRVMDSNDLLIELDCSSENESRLVRFYLKDVRDIIDINEPIDPEEYPEFDEVKFYNLYLNKKSYREPIKCTVIEESNGDLKVNLEPAIYKYLEGYIIQDLYKITVNRLNFGGEFKYSVNSITGLINYKVYEYDIDNPHKIVVSIHIDEIDYTLYEEFTIIPTREIILPPKNNKDSVIDKAITTQDPQYLGDGIKWLKVKKRKTIK